MPFAFLQTMIIVYLVLGSCRVGSLESTVLAKGKLFKGSCRVGSLEIKAQPNEVASHGSCRVGS